VSPDLRPATPAEVDEVWPLARAAHLFPDLDAMRVFHREAPWRVQLGPRSEVLVLERWRDHLDILAARGLWAAERDVVWIVEALRKLGRAHGYGQVLSPLVAEELAHHYERAGLHRHETVVVLRMDSRAASALSPARPEGITLGPASGADIEALVRVDAACFEPFWAYEPHRFRVSASSGQRLVVARFEGEVIGYTLSTIDRGTGTLARLAVAPSFAGRGIGRALLIDAVRGMARAGAGVVSLCTQEQNAASRSLYASVGLRELHGRLVLMLGDV
jgi:GNAT superfamily N-acetyltransferase